MSARLRLFVIFLGALLVLATYTFPRWKVFFEQTQTEESFPGLVEELQPVYRELPGNDRRLYLMMRQENPEMALAMLRARIAGDVVVSEEGQTRPDVATAVVVRRGTFVELDPDNDLLNDLLLDPEFISPYQLDLWTSEGDIIIYQYPDSRKLIWMTDFVVSAGPDLRVALVRSPLPLTFDDMGADFVDFPLQGNIGDQGFIVGADIDITQFNSIVIYDATWQVIFAVALI
ncbi:MAG: DM13 domain-containing protein [Aggregatilineales bacterium]